MRRNCGSYVAASGGTDKRRLRSLSVFVAAMPVSRSTDWRIDRSEGGRLPICAGAGPRNLRAERRCAGADRRCASAEDRCASAEGSRRRRRGLLRWRSTAPRERRAARRERRAALRMRRREAISGCGSIMRMGRGTATVPRRATGAKRYGWPLQSM